MISEYDRMITHHDIEAMDDRPDHEKGESVNYGNPEPVENGSQLSNSLLPLACQSTIAVMYAYYTGRTL